MAAKILSFYLKSVELQEKKAYKLP